MASRKRSADRFYLPPLSLLCAVWKRKAAACIIAVIAGVITGVVTYKWPPSYTSEAVILVESQRIPQTFVAATVNDDLKERLSTLTTEILAYSRLLQIVKKYDLYRTERQTHAEEEIIERMRGDIDIQLVKGWSPDRPGAFRITYQGENPSTVALVANELGNLFIEENLRAREVQAAGTSEFLDNQLTDAQQRLEQQEAKLGEYKREHQGELPEQESSLIASLNRLQTQLQGVQEDLSRAEQNKVLLDNSVQSGQATAAVLDRLAARADGGAATSSPLGGDEMPSVRSLEGKLAFLRTLYTENHPDVQSTEALLAEARRRLAATQNDPKEPSDSSQTPALENPALVTTMAHERERLDALRTQETIASKQIARLNTERQQILAEINSIQVHVDRLPTREQQLASITRDYEITKTNYQSLLDKKLAAGMAADMEKRQKSERFTMLEPARVPEIPSKPNRPLIGAIGAVIGLLLAVAYPVVKAIQEHLLLGEWELPKDVVVLGRVPSIAAKDLLKVPPGHAIRALRIRKIGLAFLFLMFAVGVGTGVFFGWFSL